MSDYLDWPTRKLKRRYIWAIKKVWKPLPYASMPHVYATERAAEQRCRINLRTDYQNELKRRGWDV